MVNSRTHDSPDQVNKRKESFGRFNELGFPTRKWEEWQFTNFSGLKKESFRLVTAIGLPDLKTEEIPVLENIRSIVIVNGQYLPNKSHIPEGVHITPLSDTSNYDHQTHNILAETNPFRALNTAMMSCALSIEISAGTILETPLRILFLNTKFDEPIMNHPRILIKVGENAQGSVIEHYLGPTAKTYWNNTVSSIEICPNASLGHIRIQEESANAYHVASTSYRLARNSVLKAGHFVFGAKLFRNNLRLTFDGPGADAELNGLSLSSGNQQADTHVVVDHAHPHCTSRQLFKNILADKSRGVFNGRVVVRKGSQKTDAKQSNKNLLLSNHALMNSNPQLEIYADDVKCAHGSTTGAMDKEALFYFRSRGIDLDAARRLLINGFANEIINNIKEEPIKQYLGNRVDVWLESVNMNRANDK